jgi:hypothetical protein
MKVPGSLVPPPPPPIARLAGETGEGAAAPRRALQRDLSAGGRPADEDGPAVLPDSIRGPRAEDRWSVEQIDPYYFG